MTTEELEQQRAKRRKQAIDLDTAPDSCHIDIKQFAVLAGVSTMTIRRRIDAGEYPKPNIMSIRCVRFELGKVRQALGIRRFEDAEAA